MHSLNYSKLSSFLATLISHCLRDILQLTIITQLYPPRIINCCYNIILDLILCSFEERITHYKCGAKEKEDKCSV